MGQGKLRATDIQKSWRVYEVQNSPTNAPLKDYAAWAWHC